MNFESDFAYMEVILIGGVLIFLLVFLYIKQRIKRKVKGYIGEYKVANILSKLDKRNYFVINDVTINANGYQSQIDHVIISSYGVFVIETKNYKGTIKGSESSKDWQQVFDKNQHRFYNPILQNQGHIYAIANQLKDIAKVEYISLIVFTNKSTLKTNTTTKVLSSKDLLKIIKNYKHVTINNKQKKEIINRLLPFKTSNFSSTSKEKIANPLKENCPKCGNNLINRIGKFGKFIGCTNFPTCNFTK